MEAELQCTNAIQSMEKRLRAACHSSGANIDNVIKVSIYLPLIVISFGTQSAILFTKSIENFKLSVSSYISKCGFKHLLVLMILDMQSYNLF